MATLKDLPTTLDEGDEEAVNPGQEVDEAEFFINFEDIKTDLLPNGVYYALIVYSQAGRSQSGNAKIELRWRIEDDGTPENKLKGRQVFDRLVWSPNTMQRIKNCLRALGWEKKFGGSIKPDQLMGLGCYVTVVQKFDESNIDKETGEPYPPKNEIKTYKYAADREGTI